jgi:hypothetical protein
VESVVRRFVVHEEMEDTVGWEMVFHQDCFLNQPKESAPIDHRWVSFKDLRCVNEAEVWSLAVGYAMLHFQYSMKFVFYLLHNHIIPVGRKSIVSGGRTRIHRLLNSLCMDLATIFWCCFVLFVVVFDQGLILEMAPLLW